MVSNTSFFRLVTPECPRQHESKNPLLIFSEGTLAEFDKEQLLKLNFFKMCFENKMCEEASNSVTLPEFSLDDVQVLILLLTNESPIELILDDENLSNPYFWESLKSLAELLAIDKTDEIMAKAAAYMEVMPCLSADKVLKNYCAQGQMTPGEEENEPKFVTAAKNVLLRSLYFESREAAEAHFVLLQSYREKLRMLERDLKDKEASLSNLKSSLEQMQLQQSHIAVLSNELEKLQSLFYEHQKMFDLSCLGPARHQHAEKKLEEASWPFMREAALKSEQYLRDYSEKVLMALKKSGANMLRTDLIAYLIGPKAYLLDYYGFTFSGDDENPFEHPEITLLSSRRPRYCFALNNVAGFHLEEEMRSILFYGKIPRLPPKLIPFKIV